MERMILISEHRYNKMLESYDKVVEEVLKLKEELEKLKEQDQVRV